ncbi:MAG: C39 family peptidase [Lachnospiraceae bacterium]|nr:C39 family peptidase [Lachnospiraceae bacterium]
MNRYRDMRSRVKIALSGLLMGIVIVAVGFLFLRLRGSVVVKPNQDELLSGEAVTYRQDDETWASDLLGDSRFTMKSSGCLVTCIASAVSMETGVRMTPGVLNQIFSENQVYDSEGNIQWAAIGKMEGYSADVFSEVSDTEIAQCLASGHYPIVRVRMRGLGSYHYVLIVGIEDGDYLCMDPLENELTKLSRYLNRVYAVRMVCAE